ncbi:hypothetical protein DPMN_017591 [Dreissena polymorpha]|uniref:Uncharacterized protein n=1 Tax=Dreissena polymorpha TaxID=45954 RepID=A0A9D4S5K6_DREPO|nr:hypothetical protein DPMN_017591 [Dreissena polymorpha]
MNNKWPFGSHVFLTDLNHFLARLFSEKTRAFVIASSSSAVSSRLFTCFHYIHIKKTAPLPGGHVFSLITTIFKLVRDIHITNAKHVTSRVKKTPPRRPCFLPIQTIIELNCPIQEKCPAQVGIGSHIFQAKVTIFELIQDIIGTNHLSKFYEDRKINVASRENAPPPGGHVFQPTDIILKLVKDIFYEDRTINVASRVLIRLKNAPPLGSHVFQANVTIFELFQDVIETNILTKFHEDWTINKMLTSNNARRTKGDHKSSP